MLNFYCKVTHFQRNTQISKENFKVVDSEDTAVADTAALAGGKQLDVSSKYDQYFASSMVLPTATKYATTLCNHRLQKQQYETVKPGRRGVEIELRSNRRIANHRIPLKSKQYEIIPIEIKAQ